MSWNKRKEIPAGGCWDEEGLEKELPEAICCLNRCLQPKNTWPGGADGIREVRGATEGWGETNVDKWLVVSQCEKQGTEGK